MTIGELFIKLGFKIDGDKDLQVVERGMTRATGSATKLALEVAALNALFFAMIDTSMRAAVAFRNFALSTGLSTQELQMWQHIAAVNGISAGDLTNAIKTLQNARSDFALGNPQNVGAWTLLGVDPRQDPFVVLESLRRRLKDVRDVGVARNLLGQVGLENMLPLLRSTNLEWEKWSKNFLITQEQQDKLVDLNAAWQSLKMSVQALSIQFSSLFVPVLGAVARGLTWVVDKASIFVRWLASADPIASILRWTLEAMAIGLIALGAALSVLIGLGVTFTAILAAIAPLLIGIGIALSPFVITLGLMAVGIAALILLLNDWWVAINGGQSALDWSASIAVVDAMTKAIEFLIDTWKEAVGHFKEGQHIFEKLFSHLPNWALAIPSSANTGGSSSSQSNHTEININESGSPRATGREVLRSLQEVHRGALNQAPVRSF
jgi:hypothetical protein